MAQARDISTLLLATVLLMPASERSRVPASASDSQRVLRIRVLTDGADVEGHGVAVARQDRPSDTVLHLLTAARLFRAAGTGEPLSWRGVRVDVGAAVPIDVGPRDVVVSGSRLADVAIVRVAVPTSSATAAALIWTMPEPGESIRIEGFDASGGTMALDARARFVSTRLVRTDRDASVLRGCLGAPAFVGAGVVGIVAECTRGFGAVVSTFWMDRWFIERTLPRPPAVTTRTEP